MWNRKELKARAKASFKTNYWPCVLVAFLAALALSTGTGRAVSTAADTYQDSQSITTIEQFNSAVDSAEDVFSDPNASVEDLLNSVGIPTETANAGNTIPDGAPHSAVTTAFAGGGLIFLLLNIFVFGPLQIGTDGFFTVNADEKARVSEIGRGFKYGYFENVATALLQKLFIALWSLLFIVPGIIKGYSYRMAPYIRADHPEMSAMDCIRVSKAMMDGQKKNAFVLDLSFLGWIVLEILTLGLVGFFWSKPYYYQANAELYRTLSEGFDFG